MGGGAKDASSSSDQKNKKREEETKTVSYGKLFSFGDSTDVLLMVLGTIGALANGISMPLMTLLFGRMSDAFGKSTESSILREVSEVGRDAIMGKKAWTDLENSLQVSLQFVYLAVGTGIACFLREFLPFFSSSLDECSSLKGLNFC